MNQILGFIAASMGYLWDGGRFRVVGSDVTTHNGGDSDLRVEGGHVRMRFVTDKTQLFLDLQPVEGDGREWFSIDLVRRLYTGHRERSAVLDESYAEFLGEHLDDLDDRFSPARWPGTEAELKERRSARSQEMFG